MTNSCAEFYSLSEKIFFRCVGGVGVCTHGFRPFYKEFEPKIPKHPHTHPHIKKSHKSRIKKLFFDFSMLGGVNTPFYTAVSVSGLWSHTPVPATTQRHTPHTHISKKYFSELYPISNNRTPGIFEIFIFYCFTMHWTSGNSQKSVYLVNFIRDKPLKMNHFEACYIQRCVAYISPPTHV